MIQVDYNNLWLQFYQRFYKGIVDLIFCKSLLICDIWILSKFRNIPSIQAYESTSLILKSAKFIIDIFTLTNCKCLVFSTYRIRYVLLKIVPTSPSQSFTASGIPVCIRTTFYISVIKIMFMKLIS